MSGEIRVEETGGKDPHTERGLHCQRQGTERDDGGWHYKQVVIRHERAACTWQGDGSLSCRGKV